MCNYHTMKAPDQTPSLFDVAVVKEIRDPQYFIGPSNPTQVVFLEDGNVTLEYMRWGFIPQWASAPGKDKDGKADYNPYTNARTDKLLKSGLWTPSFKARRAIIPSTGGIEYTGSKSPKQPWIFKPKGADVFGFAGMWMEWKSDSEVIRCCTIITGEPNPLLAKLHDRQACFLDPKYQADWLNPKTSVEAALAMVAQAWPAEDTEIFPIRKKPKNEPQAGDAIGVPLTLEDDVAERMRQL